jgi:hypothetical protein
MVMGLMGCRTIDDIKRTHILTNQLSNRTIPSVNLADSVYESLAPLKSKI